MTTTATIPVEPAAPRRPARPAAFPVAAAPVTTAERGKFARTVLFALAMLLAIEAAVRVRAHVLHGRSGPQNDVLVRDARLGTVPRPGAAMIRDGATTTINRWGMRSRDCGLVKPAGTWRVLCLGESTTFGQPGDDDAVIWPAQLERLLKGRGHRVEVLNGAVIGYNVGQSRLRFEQDLARFAPDIVIVNHAATNIAAHARRQFAPSGGPPAAWSLPVLRDTYSLAYNLLRANTAAVLAAQFPATRCDRLDDKGVTLFADDLAGLIQDCRGRGAAVVLCTFPRAFDEGQPAAVQRRLAQSALFFNPRLSVAGLCDAYTRYNAVIRRVAREQGVALVDLDGEIPRDEVHFIDSVHFSPRGHAEAARCVGQTLSDLMRTAGRGWADAVQ